MKIVVNCWYKNSHNDRRYRVLSVSNENATRPNYPITVSYVDTDNKVWSNTIEDFIEKMKPDDKYLRN